MPERAIEKVLGEHTSTLMSLPGIIGTAEGKIYGKPCIIVFVSGDSADALRQIPSSIEGYAVTIVESGDFHALDTRG